MQPVVSNDEVKVARRVSEGFYIAASELVRTWVVDIKAGLEVSEGHILKTGLQQYPVIIPRSAHCQHTHAGVHHPLFDESFEGREIKIFDSEGHWNLRLEKRTPTKPVKV